eukprot:2682913-Rhodomonas_salina.1
MQNLNLKFQGVDSVRMLLRFAVFLLYMSLGNLQSERDGGPSFPRTYAYFHSNSTGILWYDRRPEVGRGVPKSTGDFRGVAVRPSLPVFLSVYPGQQTDPPPRSRTFMNDQP